MTTRALTLSVEQAGQVLGVGRSTAYELVHTGAIPSMRLRRRVVIPVGPVAEQLGVTMEDVWSTIERCPASSCHP